MEEERRIENDKGLTNRANVPASRAMDQADIAQLITDCSPEPTQPAQEPSDPLPDPEPTPEAVLA